MKKIAFILVALVLVVIAVVVIKRQGATETTEETTTNTTTGLSSVLSTSGNSIINGLFGLVGKSKPTPVPAADPTDD